MFREFKTQLITGLLSSPVIYISHFDNNLVDDTLKSIIQQENGRSILPLSTDDIGEYDTSKGFVDFNTKQTDRNLSAYSNLNTLIRDIVDKKNLVNGKVFLFKNCSEILKNVDVQITFQTFASKYERKDYDPLTTIIICSPLPITSLPPELESIITVVEIGAPTEDEIHEYVDRFKVTSALTTDKKRAIILRNDICRNVSHCPTPYFHVR